MNTPEAPKEPQGAVPAAVRDRLRELAAKLAEERRNLNEARLLREAEVASLQTELKRHTESWQAEREQFEKTIERLNAEIEASRKEGEEWKAHRQEWQHRVQQMMEAAKLSKEREAKLQEEKLALEDSLKDAAKEKARQEGEHNAALAKAALSHQEHLCAALEEVETILKESDVMKDPAKD
jgi:chromosome segregation ATPase